MRMFGWFSFNIYFIFRDDNILGKLGNINFKLGADMKRKSALAAAFPAMGLFFANDDTHDRYIKDEM